MKRKSRDELRADWIAAQNITRFQNLLKSETDESRYRILEGLLADEFQKFRRSPSL